MVNDLSKTLATVVPSDVANEISEGVSIARLGIRNGIAMADVYTTTSESDPNIPNLPTGTAVFIYS